MVTSMQVENDVKRELEALKREHDLKSVSAVVKKLLKQCKHKLKG